MSTPQVGDACKADPDGEYSYGIITAIVNDLAYSNLKFDFCEVAEFCGDIPTRKEDGVWVFDSY